MLDDVKREVIKPAKTPNRNHQQHNRLPTVIIENEQEGGREAGQQEQRALELNPIRIGQVFHRR
jgi:hypothetical protein